MIFLALDSLFNGGCPWTLILLLLPPFLCFVLGRANQCQLTKNSTRPIRGIPWQEPDSFLLAGNYLKGVGGWVPFLSCFGSKILASMYQTRAWKLPPWWAALMHKLCDHQERDLTSCLNAQCQDKVLDTNNDRSAAVWWKTASINTQPLVSLLEFESVITSLN